MWNCDYLRLVRRRMLEGLEVEACAVCYATESDGGTSLRQSMNRYASRLSASSGEDSLLAKAEAIVRQNGGHAPPPSALHLWLGNLCNMKCRMCSPMFSSMVASDTVQARWLGELTRSESLLPAYLDGVDYMGFGELVRHGERWAREVTRPNATISLPSSGDPIDLVEISGVNHSNQACHLSLVMENGPSAGQWLPGGEWKLVVRPESVWCPAARVQLSLHFLSDSSQYIEIDNLTIVTRGRTGKEQPREILSRLPENPYWAKNEKVVFEEIFGHAEHLKQIHFSGGEPLIQRIFREILEKLVDAGHASHIGLYINSNGTVYSRRCC
jgi:pyruvate-formate lyase-activating enzyme